jgi:hypothetical protein
MTQAARSGVMNNVEGNERTSTSKETEMKLTNVAHASLSELKGDYEKWLLRHGKIPWSIDFEESQQIYSMRLDKPNYGKDLVRDSCAHILAQKAKFARWLDAADHEVVPDSVTAFLTVTSSYIFTFLIYPKMVFLLSRLTISDVFFFFHLRSGFYRQKNLFLSFPLISQPVFPIPPAFGGLLMSSYNMLISNNLQTTVQMD